MKVSETQAAGLLRILQHGAAGGRMMAWQTYRSLCTHGLVLEDWDENDIKRVQLSDTALAALGQRADHFDVWLVENRLYEQAILEDQARAMKLGKATV